MFDWSNIRMPQEETRSTPARSSLAIAYDGEPDAATIAAAAAALREANAAPDPGLPSLQADRRLRPREAKVVPAVQPKPERPLPWRQAAVVVFAAGAGAGAGWWGSTQQMAGPAQVPAALPVVRSLELHLDKDFEAFGSRVATADFQDSSRRLVSPNANQ